MSATARARRQRQALRRELERVSQIVEEKTREALAVLDEHQRVSVGAKGEVLEAQIIGDEIVVDATDPPAPRRTRTTWP
jgi:hypothetical protein